LDAEDDGHFILGFGGSLSLTTESRPKPSCEFENTEKTTTNSTDNKDDNKDSDRG